MSQIPAIRLRRANQADVRTDADFVLYWMTAFRRTSWNYSLQRAVDWALDLKKPLVVFEALRCDYPWASDRLHYFVVQGMADNARRLRRKPVFYYPYLEPGQGAAKGLLARLARRACVVVSDDFPSFFLPRMAKAAARQIAVRLELVDSNGILPLRAADKVFARAHDFRRFMQKNVRPHLEQFPDPDPLAGVRLPRLTSLPVSLTRKWRPADPLALATHAERLAPLPIDHQVAVAPVAGGAKAAEAALRRFLAERLDHYNEARNQPQREVTSGLAPYLHFGHIAVHQVFSEIMQHDEWSADCIAAQPNGSARGWWGARPESEAFLDQLITWREVGFNMSWQRDDYDRYESLPDWAKKTLAEHANDPRQYTYSLRQFRQAATHDPLWNAAQQQLLREGRMHNYLRMLWGKKILEWSSSPQAALNIMIELNNRYALDGRNPNSYSGIFWCLGRYDRAWGPQRPVFGKVRYMSSENTARKVRVKEYLKRYAPESENVNP
jgi:deoxyribodipyrimidine photo-lyase